MWGCWDDYNISPEKLGQKGWITIFCEGRMLCKKEKNMQQ